MGQHSCCNKQKVKRRLWSPEEDEKLTNYISIYGHGCWSTVPQRAGLQRSGKSCRLRWINNLRPDLKRGRFSPQEVVLIIDLHKDVGNRWAQIAKHLPGRTDNEVKNFWNSSVKKKLVSHSYNSLSELPILPNLFTNNYNEVPNFHQSSSSFLNAPPPPPPSQNPRFVVPNAPNLMFFQGFDQFAQEFNNNFTNQANQVNQLPFSSNPCSYDHNVMISPPWPNMHSQNTVFSASDDQIQIQQQQQMMINGHDSMADQYQGLMSLPPLEAAANNSSQEAKPMGYLSSIMMSSTTTGATKVCSEVFLAPVNWFSESVESLMSLVTAASSSSGSPSSCSQMVMNPNQAHTPGWGSLEQKGNDF